MKLYYFNLFYFYNQILFKMNKPKEKTEAQQEIDKLSAGKELPKDAAEAIRKKQQDLNKPFINK